MNFAQNLKNERKLIKLSQEQFAKEIGVTQQAISLYEKGKRKEKRGKGINPPLFH